MQDNKKMLNKESTFPEMWDACNELERAAIRNGITKETGVSRSSIWRWVVRQATPRSEFIRRGACRVASRVLGVKFNHIKMFNYDVQSKED